MRAKLREQERAEKEAELKARERHRLETALRAAHTRVQTDERALARLQKELHAAEGAVAEARMVARDLERRLKALDDPD